MTQQGEAIPFAAIKLAIDSGSSAVQGQLKAAHPLGKGNDS